MKDLEGFKERYALNSRVVKRDGKLVEEVYRIGGRYDKEIRAIVQNLEAAIPFATPTMKEALNALIQWYRTGEDSRPRRLRRRLGPGQGLAGRHDQRVHRGLHGSARPQGIVGSARLLREPREDRRDPQARHQRAVVRGSDAVGRPIQEAGRARHHRECHRRRDRDRRLGADHAGWHQPAERSADQGEARQQVGVALERQRGVRQVDVRIVPARVRVDRRRGARARRSGTASPASSPRTCTR